MVYLSGQSPDAAAHAQARRRPGQSDLHLTQAIAAIRESFEELGVLFARHADGRWANHDDIAAVFCEGHTTGQMLPLVGSGDRRALYAADMVPTAAHVRMPWIMGYDVEPLVTLESKRALLADALRDDWLLIFEHDAAVGFGRVTHDGKSYRLAE